MKAVFNDSNARGFTPIKNQRKHIDSLLKIYNGDVGHSKKGAAVCTSYGSGKTPMSLVVANVINDVRKGGILVITQMSPIKDWVTTCTEVFNPPLSTFQIRGRSDTKKNARIKSWYEVQTYDVVIVNYEMLSNAFESLLQEQIEQMNNKLATTENEDKKRRIEAKIESKKITGKLSPLTSALEALFVNEWSVVILDEAHEIRNNSTAVHKAVMNLKAGFKIAASATIYNNSIEDVVAIMSAIDISVPNETDALKQCMANYFVHDGEEVMGIDRSHYQPTDMVVHCDFETAREREVYESAKDENILLCITQQRSACSGIFKKDALGTIVPTKVKVVLEYAKIPASREEKMFVICENKDSVAILSAYMQKAFPKANIFSATCSMGGKRRDDIRYMFELAKGFSVLISTNIFTQGVNLACANHTIIYDVWWNGVLADQGKSRCERPSQKRSVFTLQIVMANTIEESIWNVAHQKRIMRKQLLSGDAVNDISIKITSEIAKQILEEDGKTINEVLSNHYNIYFSSSLLKDVSLRVPQTQAIVPLVSVPELVDIRQQELLRARRAKEFSAFFKSISFRFITPSSTQRIMKGRYTCVLSSKRQKRQTTDDRPVRYENLSTVNEKRRRTLKV